MREKTNSDKNVVQNFMMSYPDFLSEKRLGEIRDKILGFYESLRWEEQPDLEPFFYAMVAYGRLQETNPQKSPYIWVVDFSKSNSENRFFVINLGTLTVENATCVWHWKNSWWEIPSKFSNKKWSLQSSLWAFRTIWDLKENTKWTWKWLMVEWLEDTDYRAESRWIFIHPWGVDKSEGCFTIPTKWNDLKEFYDITNKLKWWCLVYAYYSEEYLKDSWIVNPSSRNIVSMGKKLMHDFKLHLKSNASKTKKSIIKAFTKDKWKSINEKNDNYKKVA